MKVAVLGGGSSYTPELINGFLERINLLPVSELWLHDILPDRLDIVGGYAKRMVAAKGNPFKVYLTSDQKKAISGAQYVITQFRIGWMEARREDEYLGRRHGLIGQETTGVGGMAKALRTIPVVLNVAKTMQECAASDALLVNFTNPAGLVTQALATHAPNVPSVGVCNAPVRTLMGILKDLKKVGIDVAPEEAELDTLGLNHLTWYRGLTVKGKDLWPQVMRATIENLKNKETPEWPPSLLASLNMLPTYYLAYFYNTKQELSAQANGKPSRADTVIEIEKRLLQEYANPQLVEMPADLLKRGGAYYSTVATQFLASHFNDLKERQILNVANNGAVADWPADWVLEMPCTVGKQGITPIAAKPLPPVAFALMQQVKMFELLTVEAAVTGDRNAAYQALLTNPLGPTPADAEKVLNDMLFVNRNYLPQFFPTPYKSEAPFCDTSSASM